MCAQTMSVFNERNGCALLESNYNHFDDFWNLPKDWIEPINSGNGGWSGVSKIHIAGTEDAFYIKRQQAQVRRTARRPFGALSYKLEYEHLRNSIPIGKPDWVYFGESTKDHQASAVLVTQALPTEFKQLQLLVQDKEYAYFNASLDNFKEIGAQLCAMHQHKFRHAAFFASHIFVNPDTCEVRLIDFERSRYCLSATVAARKDLSQFLRRHHSLSTCQLHALLSPYRQHLPSALG